jgi:hypothetical protein
VDWRREDWGYAAATLVAAAFVAYLVAGNFGLVGTPFGRLDAGASPVTPAIASPRLTPGGLTGSPSPSPTTAPPPGAARRGTDRSSPSGEITTAEGTSLTATEGKKVTGTATDEGSGVDKVFATFDPGSGEPTTVPASVSCSDPSQTSCTWSADVPDVAGDYEVTARVIDRAGNSSVTPPRHITVVNVGGAVDELLPGVVDALRGLLGG